MIGENRRINGLRGIDILMIKQRIIDMLGISGIKNPTYCKLKESSNGMFVFSFLYTSFSTTVVDYLKKELKDVEVDFDHKNKYSMIITVKGAREIFLNLLPAH